MKFLPTVTGRKSLHAISALLTVECRWDAHVVDTSQDHVLVHYVGGTTEEDEWIPKGSERIRNYKVTSTVGFSVDAHLLLQGVQLLTPRTPANCCTPQVQKLRSFRSATDTCAGCAYERQRDLASSLRCSLGGWLVLPPVSFQVV